MSEISLPVCPDCGEAEPFCDPFECDRVLGDLIAVESPLCPLCSEIMPNHARGCRVPDRLAKLAGDD
jgi:hypothetical protein